MSKNEEHKKHHYVPQIYLRQFAHSNGKQKNPIYFLNAYNRKSLKPFPKNVEDACQLSHFYRISDEYLYDNPHLNALSLEVEHFADYVETNLTIILEEVCRRKEDCVQRKQNIFPMVEKDKYLLAEQIVVMFFRHPRMRKFELESFENVYSKMIRLFQQNLAIELNNSEIADLNIGIKKDEALFHASQTYLNDEIVSRFAKDLSQNLWSFVYSPEKKFMTSDNPIVCIQQFPDERALNLGLNQKGAIKFFALSPDLLLIMMDETLTPGVDCKFGITTEKCLTTYHKALCNQSNEVYSYQPFENKFTL